MLYWHSETDPYSSPGNRVASFDCDLQAGKVVHDALSQSGRMGLAESTSSLIVTDLNAFSVAA